MRALKFRNVVSVLIICVGLTSLGCGSGVKLPDASQQSSISGKVTFDGTKPVPLDSIVVFFSIDKGATLVGTIDALGQYTVRVTERSVGIPSGRYKIMVRPPEKPTVTVGDTPDYTKLMTSGGVAKKAAGTADIPAKFLAADSTPIVLEIKPGKNDVDLDLSKFK